MHNWQYENYLCSTDKSKLQLEMIHDFLCNQSYWAKGRTIEQVIKSINHSECFGIYREEQQLGFARVISDFTVYAYLLDVFIVEQKRGSGLGKFLMECIMSHPGLKVKRWMLGTEDAHGLYQQYGFTSLKKTANHMERVN